MLKTHKDISIQFLSVDDDPSEARAEIRLGNEEMVISILEPYGPYLVKGRLCKNYSYAGVDTLKDEIHVDLKARWALLGDTYVGIWIKNGKESLMMFRLPRASLARGRG